MDSNQVDEVVELLTAIRDEIVGLRSDFMEFTSHNVYNMKNVSADVGDHITGSSEGVGGTTLDELKHAIEAIEAAVTAQ